MYRIAIANEKGGVAKTTTTVSLGAALAEAGHRVLVVDLDGQANLTLALGLDPNEQLVSISKVLLSGAPLPAAIQTTVCPRLDILTSNHEMANAERFLPIQKNYEYILRNAVQSLDNTYQYVLYDCPPFLGAATMNALVAADMLLVPTQPEYFSIYALRNLMDWVRMIRSKYNPALTYRLIMTMFDKRNKTHRVLAEQLAENFQSGLLNSFIAMDTKLRESPIAGLPILMHATKSRAAMQYRSLALEIEQHAQETTLQPA
ncbi:MAG: ParA family protein [Chloroflexi bacterium]|nr:ParA family protein [Chloroflexota bacterium]